MFLENTVFIFQHLLTEEGQLEPDKGAGVQVSTHLLVRKDGEEAWDQAWAGQMGPLVRLMLLFRLVKGHMLLSIPIMTIMALFSGVRLWVSS